MLGMDAVILETHAADREEDCDANAILSPAFHLQTVLLWAGLEEERGTLLQTLD